MTHWTVHSSQGGLVPGNELRFCRTIRDGEPAGLAPEDEVDIRFPDGSYNLGIVAKASIKGAHLRVRNLLVRIRRRRLSRLISTNGAAFTDLWVVCDVES